VRLRLLVYGIEIWWGAVHHICILILFCPSITKQTSILS